MNRKLRYGLAGAAAVAALLAALPFALPASVYKEPIERSVTGATGRAFTISGPLHFTLFPALGLSAQNVALANPAGWPKPALATAQALRIAVRLRPLLAGRIEISEIVVEKPQIDLAVDAGGHANWTLARGRAKPAAKGGGGGGSEAFTTSFSHMTVEGGSLTYSNARTKSAFALGDLNAAVSGSGYDAPVSLTGAFTYRGQKVDVGAKASAPRAVLEETQADIDLSLGAALLQTEFHGRISTDGSVQGHAALKSPSIRQAGAWLGAKLPATGGLGAFALTAAVKGDNRHAELSDMNLMLDGAAMTGALSVDTHAPTPQLRGALSIDALNLNPYIEAPHGTEAAPRPQRDPKHEEEWSRAPIRLDALHKFNGELSIETGSLHVRSLALGRTHMDVSLADGALHAHLGPMALYGGSGTADVAVDARTATPKFHDTAAFDNVALQPFLADTIGVKQIEGAGTIRLDASSEGTTADAIMHGLTGKGSIALRDGRLRGVDLGAVARAIQQILNGAVGPGNFTDYSALSGSFTIADGVLTSNDFHLKGPLLETTGAGSVDIGGRAIDFRIVPVVLKLGLPFRIKGPWRHVHYTADLKGIVAGVLGNLESGKAPFKGLFGRSSKPDANAPKKKHKSVGDALKNMLGIH